MMHPLFGDTITLYHRMAGDEYGRTVLSGVQWRQKTERTADGSGKLQMATVTSVTIPAGIGTEIGPGDVMVLGTGPELAPAYTLAQLKRDHPTYCTVRGVTDNRLRPRLKHRKVVAV